MMPRTTATTAWTAALVLVGSALMSAPGFAQDSGVKDLLGKAQSQSETKAVEDLITKLKRQQAKPTVPATKEEPAAASGGTQAKPPEPTAKPAGPATPEKDASAKEPAPTAGSTAPAPTAATAPAETPSKSAQDKQP